MSGEIKINMGCEELVRIEEDGTVIIHKEGGDKEAAKAFYECLEFEGQTLHKKIKDLEEKNKELQRVIDINKKPC